MVSTVNPASAHASRANHRRGRAGRPPGVIAVAVGTWGPSCSVITVLGVRQAPSVADARLGSVTNGKTVELDRIYR
jgi:hypothetical protein